MESPPSFSGWSEAPISISEDSGLPLTSGSVSSGSVSGERVICELPDSDGEDKSLSQYDSLDYSDSGGMCGEHFNTLKKGPTVINLPIDPPPEFQDSPPSPATRIYDLPTRSNIPKPWLGGSQICSSQSAQNRSSREGCSKRVLSHRLWPADTVAFSPVHSLSRPGSCSAASGSRLYSSHNSLSVVQNGNPDDSNFITQAMSHDALNREISDIYNVPFDSDIYALPVDTVRPLCEHNSRISNSNKAPVSKPKRHQVRQHRKRRRNTSASSQCELDRSCDLVGWERITSVENDMNCQRRRGGKRHSVAGSSGATSNTHIAQQEPLHMTLEEVRNYLHTLYSSSSDSSENQKNRCDTIKNLDNNNHQTTTATTITTTTTTTTTATSYRSPSSVNCAKKTRNKKTFMLNVKNKKVKDSSASTVVRTAKEAAKDAAKDPTGVIKKNCEAPSSKQQKKSGIALTLQSLCGIFRFRNRADAAELKKPKVPTKVDCDKENFVSRKKADDLCRRALPPLPSGKLRVEGETHEGGEDTSMDFTLSIEKVKDYGWYWGPISGEAAERILLNEPDGSFIVRDSSDHHYIFSLTFKLNGCVRHVRIEHDQGNFSFGSCTKFKSHTIVEFIENAVEHSRSGRYLFFLHRRPVLGPMRVQLLHPVSRFKQVQSLQHMCRFIILKHVRRDLIPSLPLPRRVIDYLSTKQYYSELLADGDCAERIGDDDEQSAPGQADDLDQRPPNQTLAAVPPAPPPQSAVVHVITTETNRDGLDRYRFHVIDTDSSDVEPPSPSPATAAPAAAAGDVSKEGGGAGGSSDSSDLNEIEGIRRGGRFRLGLRTNNRERRFGQQRQQHCCDDS